MPRLMSRGLFICLVFTFLAGCSSSRMNVRGYIHDKPREDQEFSGNDGYVMGDSKRDESQERDLTREVVVVEFTKGMEDNGIDDMFEEEIEKDVPTSKFDRPEQERQRRSPLREKFNFPDFDSDDDKVYEKEPLSEPSSFVEYTIGKDDTLQKISKKFYNSYSKWQRIYEANKEKISNPDQIQPGITIVIPMD